MLLCVMDTPALGLHPKGLAFSHAPAVHRHGRCWGGPTQSPASGLLSAPKHVPPGRTLLLCPCNGKTPSLVPLSFVVVFLGGLFVCLVWFSPHFVFQLHFFTHSGCLADPERGNKAGTARSQRDSDTSECNEKDTGETASASQLV